MNSILQFFKKLITPKEKEYIYFRNTKRYYYGLCSTETRYTKIEEPECRWDKAFIGFEVSRNGYKECTKEEYDFGTWVDAEVVFSLNEQLMHKESDNAK